MTFLHFTFGNFLISYIYLSQLVQNFIEFISTSYLSLILVFYGVNNFRTMLYDLYTFSLFPVLAILEISRNIYIRCMHQIHSRIQIYLCHPYLNF